MLKYIICGLNFEFHSSDTELYETLQSYPQGERD